MSFVIKEEKNEMKLVMKKLCDNILKIRGVQFAGIIDPIGSLYAGGFKEGVTPKINDEQRRHIYLKFALESCFRKDFDDVLGKFRFSITQREKGSILTTNICNHLLLVFTEIHIQDTDLMKKIQKTVKDNELATFYTNH